MKSVIVRILGGLGNQLGCYAFGRALSIRNDMSLLLDTESGFLGDPFKRQYLLDRFPGKCANSLPHKYVTRTQAKLFKLNIRIRLLFSRIVPLRYKLAIKEEKPFRYRAELVNTEYFFNPYFIGYWSSYKYYANIEGLLRRELRPPAPIHPDALEILNRIERVRSCFIHWRSYIDDKNVNHPSIRKYYRDAMNLVISKIPDVEFFVFSDHPDAVRYEIPAAAMKVHYVNLRYSQDNIGSLADFYLMHRCNHAIIGDSTFSWWAAWLREDVGRIVIAPRGLSPWGDDWIPQEWIALETSTLVRRDA